MELIAVLAVLAYLASTAPSGQTVAWRALPWFVVVVLCALQVWRLWVF